MKISKAHRNFAKRLNNQGILNYSEQYLGPNWENVINFWLYLDTLSKEQLKVAEKRYLALSNDERYKACSKSWITSESTTKYASVATRAPFHTGFYPNYVAAYATRELIGLDKLLEQGHQPVFFPMFLNP
jgi:hypothetical protein